MVDLALVVQVPELDEVHNEGLEDTDDFKENTTLDTRAYPRSSAEGVSTVTSRYLLSRSSLVYVSPSTFNT